MLQTLDYKIGDVVGYVDVEKPAPIATDGPLHWLIGITEPSREVAAAARITDLGLKPYLPLLHKQVAAGRGRKRDIEIALFTSRIFIPMPDDSEAYHRVLAVRGMRDFMRIDRRRPATLPEAAIEQIRRSEARADAKYRRRLASEEASPYRRGRKVWAEILPSPYDKLLATIEDMDAQGRVNVLLEIELLGRKVWPVAPHLLQFVEV